MYDELIQKLEMKDIYTVDIDVNGDKFIHREGCFASTFEEVKQYAWYYPKEKDENISLGAMDYLYDDEPGEIVLMNKRELLVKLADFVDIKPLRIIDSTVDIELGKYYDAL